MTDVHSEPKFSIATSDYRCVECSGEVACDLVYYSAVIFSAGEFQRRNYCSDCWRRRAAHPGSEAAGASPPEEAQVFASWRTRRPAAPAAGPPKVRFDRDFVFAFFLRLGGDPADVARGVDADSDRPVEAEGELEEASPHGTDGDTYPAHDIGTPAHGESSEHPHDAEAPPGGPGVGVDTAGDGSPSASSSSEVVAAEREQLRFFLALLLIRKKVLTLKSSEWRDGRELLLVVDRATPPRVHEVPNPGLTQDQLANMKDRLGELLQMRL